jgi:hypothetical protein
METPLPMETPRPRATAPLTAKPRATLALETPGSRPTEPVTPRPMDQATPLPRSPVRPRGPLIPKDRETPHPKLLGKRRPTPRASRRPRPTRVPTAVAWRASTRGQCSCHTPQHPARRRRSANRLAKERNEVWSISSKRLRESVTFSCTKMRNRRADALRPRHTASERVAAPRHRQLKICGKSNRPSG